MTEITEKWLEELNQRFSSSDIPHAQRPWLAISEWAKYTGLPISMSSEDAKKIFAWFEKNTKVGSQYIGRIYTGAFYYDSCFWPVFIPLAFGRVKLYARDALKTIPENILARLWRDRNALKALSRLRVRY